MGIFKEFVTSGALIALGTIAGIFFKYLLDRRKVDKSHLLEVDKLEDLWVEKEFGRLTSRILALEDAYQKCIKGESERERAIGHLSGEVEGLKGLLIELQSRSNKEIVEQATVKAVVTHSEKFDTAIQATTDAIAKNTEKIDTAIETANKAIDKLK